MQLAKTSGKKGSGQELFNEVLNWNVVKKPVLYKNNNDKVEVAENYSMIVREDDAGTGGFPLGIVGKNYEPIQNSQMWEAMQNALYDINHTIDNIGTLDNGGRVFIQALVQDKAFKIGEHDMFNSYLTMWSSHNGSCSYIFADTLKRIWCSNTFNASMHGEHKFKIHIKHTKNASIRFENMHEQLDEIFDHRRKLFKEIKRISEMPISRKDAQLFSLGFVGSDKTRGANIAEDINKRFRKGIANEGKTRYDMWNGITEYYTHGNKDKPTEQQREAQYKASELGTGARAKVRALNVLTNEKQFNDTIQRGKYIKQKLAKA